MSWLLDNPDREYIESVKTDVMKTWRKFGFVPPSEQIVDFKDSLDALNNLTIRKPSNALENLHQVQDKETTLSVSRK